MSPDAPAVETEAVAPAPPGPGGAAATATETAPPGEVASGNGASGARPARRRPQPRWPVGGDMRPWRFRIALATVVLGAAAVRFGYVLVVTRYENSKLYDSLWYGFTALGLTIGQFFRVAFGTAPSAAHPPLTSMVLAPATYFFGFHDGLTPQRLTMAVLGTAVVLCTGLLGKAVAGPWVGLTAAVLAAGYPNFWIPNGILMSETPAMLGMALILLAVVRLRRRPTMVSAVLLGLSCGAEVLVRAELVLLVPLLLVPAALAARPAAWGRRFALAGVGVLAAALVVAPWVGRNLATFEDPTYLSTGNGLALLGANCPGVYRGPYLGSWSLKCALSVQPRGDESVVSAEDQHVALRYAGHHLGRLPVVMAARVGRLWDFYQPFQMADYDVNEGRPRDASLAGLFVYWALLPFAIAGAAILRRRRLRPWFLLVPAFVLTVVSALFYGLVRFRAPFEDCLVVLAAPPLVLLVEHAGGSLLRPLRRGRHAPRTLPAA